MKSLLCCIALLYVVGCMPPKTIALTGNYSKMPVVISSEKSFDQVWDRLIDLFAQKGISIKLIDRSSGLLISGKTLLTTTYESKDGKLIDPSALLVIPTRLVNGRRTPITGTSSGVYAKTLIPNPAYGEWNVRIKKTEAGSSINVNVVNITYESVELLPGGRVSRSNIDLSEYDYRSTGIFENKIAEIIK